MKGCRILRLLGFIAHSLINDTSRTAYKLFKLVVWLFLCQEITSKAVPNLLIMKIAGIILGARATWGGANVKS